MKYFSERKHHSNLMVKGNFYTKIAVLLTFIFIGGVSHNAYAQSNSTTYRTAIGVKFYPTGVTFKARVKPNAVFEVIGYFWDRGSRFTGLYEYQYNLSSDGALKWYIGPGVHVGLYKQSYYNGGTAIGVDGVLGLDYKFPGIPINLSLDWQPSYEFGDYSGFSGNWGGVGIRLAF